MQNTVKLFSSQLVHFSCICTGSTNEPNPYSCIFVQLYFVGTAVFLYSCRSQTCNILAIEIARFNILPLPYYYYYYYDIATCIAKCTTDRTIITTTILLYDLYY